MIIADLRIQLLILEVFGSTCCAFFRLSILFVLGVFLTDGLHPSAAIVVDVVKSFSILRFAKENPTVPSSAIFISQHLTGIDIFVDKVFDYCGGKILARFRAWDLFAFCLICVDGIEKRICIAAAHMTNLDLAQNGVINDASFIPLVFGAVVIVLDRKIVIFGFCPGRQLNLLFG